MSGQLGRPWTADEDAAVVARYATGDIEAIATDLDRSVIAVNHRAKRLGVAQRKRRWTKADVATLKSFWGEESLRSLAKRLGRTEATTFWRAQQEGLPLGCPQGREYLTVAAKRTGYECGQLRKILKWAGVRLSLTMSRPTGARRHFHCVDPYDVDRAVEAWLSTEAITPGARARGTTVAMLTRRLRGIEGVPSKPPGRYHWRIPSRILDLAAGAPLIDLRKARARGERGKFVPAERRAA